MTLFSNNPKDKIRKTLLDFSVKLDSSRLLASEKTTLNDLLTFIDNFINDQSDLVFLAQELHINSDQYDREK